MVLKFLYLPEPFMNAGLAESMATFGLHGFSQHQQTYWTHMLVRPLHKLKVKPLQGLRIEISTCGGKKIILCYFHPAG